MIAVEPRAAPLQGRLELVFAPGPRGTSLAHAHVSAPLKIVRPFPLDDGRALVQVLTLGPGLCAGDQYTLDITVEPGARAVVIMQAAARVLGMTGDAQATQSVNLTVHSDGQLEYYPGLTIPFADSSFVQRVHVAAAADARVGILENWSMGRSSRGEHLRFRRLSNRTTVVIDGATAYADAIELEPALTNVAATGMLENYRYTASGFWHGASPDFAGVNSVEGTLMAFGHTAPGQVYLRALAMDGYAMGRLLQSAVDRINTAWNLEAIPLRRFTS
ncbi:MAG: urease accessory protein UreD [Acidobacteriota bacterium]|nr:urease accessory protein UreD [Acidobacteriota bacterium]